MNKQRRDAISAIQARFADIRNAIGELSREVEDLHSEESEYYDTMPESFQQGDKGDKAQSAIDALESARDELESIDMIFDNADSSLESAKE